MVQLRTRDNLKGPSAPRGAPEEGDQGRSRRLVVLHLNWHEVSCLEGQRLPRGDPLRAVKGILHTVDEQHSVDKEPDAIIGLGKKQVSTRLARHEVAHPLHADVLPGNARDDVLSLEPAEVD